MILSYQRRKEVQIDRKNCATARVSQPWYNTSYNETAPTAHKQTKTAYGKSVKIFFYSPNT